MTEPLLISLSPRNCGLAGRQMKKCENGWQNHARRRFVVSFLFVERYRLSGRPQAVGESVAWFKWFSPAAPGGSFRNRLLNLIFFQFHFTERWWALFQLCSTPMNVNQWNHVKKNFGKIPRETSVEMTGVGSRWRGRGPMRRQTEKEKSFTRFTRTRMKRPRFRSPGSRVYLIT